MRKNNFISLFVLSVILFGCSETVEKKTQNLNAGEINREKSEPVGIAKDDTIPLPPIRSIDELQPGDIIMQTLEDHQSDLVSIVTQSPFTHCGIIVSKQKGGKYVLEAFSKVEQTSLEEWIKRGKDNKIVVFRLNNQKNILTGENIAKATQFVKSIKHLPYDTKFNWSDNEYYCSELVWKIYKNALNTEICPTRKLKEYDLSDEKVKAELITRYGENIPYEETIVAPSDIAASDLLTLIYSTY